MTRANLNKDPQQVAAMFDDVAVRYDRSNTVLSAGNDVVWRRATTRAVAPVAGERILDVAAGTGTSSASLAASGASIIAADFSEGMIAVGRMRQRAHARVEFVWADATDLPFKDEEFDAVTISFGLRNIVDPHKALEEFFRVTKKGGRLVVCEFSTPPSRTLRRAYRWYLRTIMPAIARFVSSDPASYTYLTESIEAWPNQTTLAGWLRAAGFTDVKHRNMSAGIVCLHRGVKSPTSTGSKLVR